MNVFRILSASSLVLGFSYIFRFALTFVLARYLTSDELGIYSWVITVFGIAGIITNFGLDFFLIRKIPEYRNSSNFKIGPVIKHTLNQSSINAFLIILVIFVLGYFSVPLFDGASLYRRELMIIIFALPFAAYSLIFSTSIRAFNFPITGQFIESIVQTGTLLLLTFIFLVFFGQLIPEGYNTFFLVLMFVFSWIFSFSCSFFIYKKFINVSILRSQIVDEKIEWRKEQSSIVFGILGWSFLGRSDIFLLAFLVAPSEVGAYFLCLRLGEILMFFQTVAYYVWGAEISNLIQGNRFDKAQDIIKKSSKLCISLTFIMAFFGFIFAEEILSLINDRYVEYDFLLKIAFVVFLIKGASGIIRPLFYILGEQDFLAKSQWIIGLVFTSLVLTTVPIFGLAGCLVSFGFCETIFFIVLAIRLHYKHNLSILPI